MLQVPLFCKKLELIEGPLSKISALEQAWIPKVGPNIATQGLMAEKYVSKMYMLLLQLLFRDTLKM